MTHHSVHRFLPLAGVLIVVLVAAAVLLFFLPSSPTSPACVNVDRLSYGIPLAVFEDLPPLPACMGSVSAAFASSSFTNPFFFSPDYFLQPEFYPTFPTEGLSKWKSPVYTHVGVIGFGSYPYLVDHPVERGTTTRLRVFVHTGFGVRSFQAVSLASRAQTPYPGVMIALDEESSHGFILGPTFPKFDVDWVKPVDILVTVAPDASFNTQEFVLVTQPVSPELLTKWESQGMTPLYSATDYVGERTVLTLRINPVPSK